MSSFWKCRRHGVNVCNVGLRCVIAVGVGGQFSLAWRLGWVSTRAVIAVEAAHPGLCKHGCLACSTECRVRKPGAVTDSIFWTAPRKTTVVSKFATSYGVYDALELLGLMSVLNDSELPMLLNASIVHELISGLVEAGG